MALIYRKFRQTLSLAEAANNSQESRANNMVRMLIIYN